MNTNRTPTLSSHLTAMGQEAGAIAADVAQSVKDAVEEKRGRALRAITKASKKASVVKRQTADVVKRNPFATVGIALAAGAALGAIVTIASRKNRSSFLQALGLA